MAGKPGFVSVPVIPTFKGMSKEFAERLEKPAQQAGKRAGKSISEGVQSGVQNLERQVKASSAKLSDLDRAYKNSYSEQEQQKEKLEAATLKLRDAEDKYQKALAGGGKGLAELAKVKEAKARLIGETEKLEQAEIDVRVAEKKHKDQLDDLNATLRKLSDEQRKAGAETDDTRGKFAKFRDSLREISSEAEGLGSSFEGISGKIGAIAGPIAAVLGGGALASSGVTTADAIAKMNRQLGYTGEVAEMTSDAVGETLRSGVASSVEEAAEAIGALEGQFKYLGSEGEQTAQQLSDNFLAFAKTFDVDMAEAAQTAGQLITNGLATDVENAADLMTVAMQKVPAQMRDELPEIINEYGTNFRALGFTGEEAFGLLVGAAEKGKWALDKTGDSLKEFTIRGSDMSKTSIEAYEALGLNAEEMSRKIAEGGEGAQDALQQTAQKLLEMEDPAERANTAIALFGTPLEDLSVDQIPQFLQSLSGAETAMGDVSGASQEMADQMANSLGGRLDKLKGTVSDLAGDAFMKLWDVVSNNKELVGSLGAAVAGLAGGFLLAKGAMIAFTAAQTAMTVATTLADGGFKALNATVKANIFVAVASAVAALVAGLVYFFTQTETGRELWEKFTTALGDGWDWVVDKLSAGWEWLSDNVFQPLGAFFTETLWPTIDSVLTWVSDKWQAMLDAVTAVWGWLRDNVLVPLASFFTDTLWPAVSSALGWVSDKWNWLYGILSSVVSWIWDNVIMRAIQGYVNLWNRAQEAIGWLVDKWNWMRDMLHAGWTWIDENVFAPLGRGLDTVKGWFQTAVDAIGRIWDGIKEKTKAPVQFVVDVVYNNGIRKAWNAVAGLVGLDKLQEIKFATGGILPGYTPGRDPYTFIEPSTGMRIGLSGGEAIMRPEATRVLGSAWVDGVNAAARVGGEAGVAEYLYGDEKKRNLGGFYSGGVIGSITDWVKKYYPMMTITSTLRNSNDYHGQGLAVDFSNGTDDTPQMQSAAMNLFTNYGKGLLELIHSPFNHNVKHGQDVGDGFGFYGAGTMNAHRNHVHVASQQPLGDPKNMVEMVWDGAKAVFRSIKERVTDLLNPIIDTVTGKLGGFNAPGVIGGLPQAFFDTVWGKAKAFILGKADEAASYSGAAGNAGNAESWREMAMAAMRRQGFNADDPAQVNAMLAQIMSESGGDPGIAQQIVDVNGTGESAGVGLLQIIPGTFAAHRDPELPDDRRDPWANMNAALRYYKSRYGTDLTTMWGQGHGYAEGGILPKLNLFDNGGWLEHGAMAVNRSGGPEPVFNASQWKTLSDVIRSVGILVPAIKAQTDVLADVAEGAQEWLAKAADPKSIEGINARSGINAFLDLGLDLPGQDVIKAVVDGESAIWDARDRQLAHLDTIAQKEQALADARKELEDLMADDGGLSKDEQRKLDDAKKTLEEAKAKQAEADSDEKRAAAADKVADAEEKLKRVREDQADNVAENAKKREEEITKANEAVKKSETELAQARQAQAKDLDNLVLLSQDSIMGMVPVAEGLAGQLTAMGAPAAMVSQGLGAVTSALGGAASMVGPAGLSLGVAVEMLKQAIGIIKKIVGFIKEIIERVRKAQLEALKTLADGLGTIAEYAKLVTEMQQRVASLQQELARGLMEQRTAMFNLRVAVADKASAEMESAISVAKARQDLDKELEAQAKARAIRMTGLFEDWDSYLQFQADVAAGMLDKWSDTAISKLYAYESARATALKGELESRLNLIKAEDAARKAALQNVRNQQDLLIAQERLIKMSGKVAGVDLEDATGMEQIAKVMAELAEAQQALDKNTVGRWGYKLGANGQFANEYRGQLAQVDSLRNVLDTLMAETGVQIDEASLNRTLQLMGETAFRGGDTMAVLRSQLPQLAAAEEKLRTNEALKPIWDVRDDAEDMRRTVEDFTNEVELYGKTQPLEESIAGLEKAILSLDQTSEAFAEGNEGLRGDYLRAADKNASSAADLGVVWKLDSSVATPGVRGQVAKEVNIALDGEAMYTADQVDKLLAEVTAGTNVRVTTRRASTVATARRNGGI